jgi:hypothetical protein
MTQVSGVTQAPALPQPVAPPLASMADRPFAYVLRGLVEAQLARSSAAPVAGPSTEPAALPVYSGLLVGPQGGAFTVGAFTLKARIRAAAE